MTKQITFIIFFAIIFHSVSSQNILNDFIEITDSTVKNGAERCDLYFPFLENKRIALVVNHTSKIGDKHLADSIFEAGFELTKIFAPEHGFRGDHSDGDHITDYTDSIIGVKVISIFGKKLKPSNDDLSDVDVVIFDIQDIGVRFYTFISTMHYIMEACAENNKELIILDRPNPNGYYVDGPILDPKYKSFIGMHKIPLVHGLTVGELALMINGEHWLENGKHCDLTVITVEGYSHSDLYQLPIMPSPNIVSMDAVYLYPSLGLFEGTIISTGRGTMQAFEIFGHPLLSNTNFEFTPKSIKGMSEKPKFLNTKCYGFDVKTFSHNFLKFYKKLYLYWITDLYKELSTKENFWRKETFDKLAGTNILREQIEKGLTPQQISDSWTNDLEKYKLLRKKYLLYPDFE